MKYFKGILFFCIFIAMINFTSQHLKKQDNTKGLIPANKLSKPDAAEIWADLFMTPRMSACEPQKTQSDIMAMLLDEENMKFGMFDVNLNFYWVKKWGFGPVAYLMDFFDPVFRDEIIKDIEEIWKNVVAFSPENLADYSDPFDYAMKLELAPPGREEYVKKEVKRFEKNLNVPVYKTSVNAVQVYLAIKQFGWLIDPSISDYAADFITKYDINNDGRLSPREFILGSIFINKPILGSKNCNYCYSAISRKIGAVFTYLDCLESGFVSAEQMWNGLKEMRRGKDSHGNLSTIGEYNLFAINNDVNIRTNAINDFVLKNRRIKDGSLNKEEFVSGVLLGVWDRQVDDLRIIKDDSRNLKSLRWSTNKRKDILAYDFAVAVERAKIEREERDRFMRWHEKITASNEEKKFQFLMKAGVIA